MIDRDGATEKQDTVKWDLPRVTNQRANRNYNSHLGAIPQVCFLRRVLREITYERRFPHRLTKEDGSGMNEDPFMVQIVDPELYR